MIAAYLSQVFLIAFNIWMARYHSRLLKKDKKIIAVPRLSKYKEHNNDHQLQITTEFSKDGFILTAQDSKEFHECLEKISKFKPKKYQSNTNNMIKLIEDYIDKGVKPC